MRKKPYSAMNADELALATAEFEGGREPSFLRPPSGERRRHDALLRKIKRGRGRPRVGAGSRRVQITMEQTLLARADRFAKAHGLSRSELIARCLVPVIGKKSA
jgi:hypothetical protein